MSISHKDISSEYLRVIKSQFEEMKRTAEKAFEQLDEEAFSWVPNNNSNSIAVIVKHISGHMISRWTDVLFSDGEKPFRNRDEEFEHTIFTHEKLYKVWDKGWNVFFKVFDTLKEEHLLREICINNQPLTLLKAIEKSMSHYSYHIGQIIYIAKQVKSDDWESLTIPRKK